MSQFNDIVIFDKKTMADIFKEIYNNSKKKDKDINDLVTQLKDLIQTIGDAVQLVPLITGYIEAGIKNNKHLIDMLSIVQKAVQRASNGGEEEAAFTEEEKKELIENYKAFLTVNN